MQIFTKTRFTTSIIILSLSFFHISSAADITHIDQTVTDGSIIKSGWFSSLKSKVISINSAGDGTNVGIGKASSPSYKLDVAGRVNSNGYCIDGDCRTAWPWASNGTQTNFNIGSVGIGTYPTSTYKLDVAGSINSTGICINGECKDNWEPDSPWTISGNNIYYTGGNVGIGTSNPVAKLDIVGTTKIDQGGSYDVWIQGGNVTSGGGRNLAMLGVKSTDTLIINHGGEYAGGTNIMGWLTVGAAVPPKEALDVHGDIISNGANTWRFHTPDDGRASLYFGRGANGVISEWPVEFRAGGTIAAGAFIYNSDKRLKTNIKDLNDSNDILKISAKRFDWKDEKNKQVPKNDIGVIAQDVEKYFPEFVETNENGIKAVNYPKLVVPLISVVKEQQNQIEKLEERLSILENKN